MGCVQQSDVEDQPIGTESNNKNAMHLKSIHGAACLALVAVDAGLVSCPLEGPFVRLYLFAHDSSSSRLRTPAEYL